MTRNWPDQIMDKRTMLNDLTVQDVWELVVNNPSISGQILPSLTY